MSQFGGHADVNKAFSALLGVKPTSNFGFSFTVEADGKIAMGFNSGMPNPHNPLGNGTRTVPPEFQSKIINAVENATCKPVKIKRSGS